LFHQDAAAVLAGRHPVQSGGVPGQRFSLELLWRIGCQRGHQPGHDTGVPGGMPGGRALDLQDGLPAQDLAGSQTEAVMAWNEVQALVLDVFGTVVDWRTGVAREAAPFLARHGQGRIEPLAFADAWRSHYGPSMQAVRSGQRPFVRLDVLHRENLEATLRD